MLARVVIAIGLIAVGLGSYRLWIFLQLRRASTHVFGLEERQVGKYLILYFTSPTCVPCRTVQRPALQTVQNVFGNQLQIITIDVTEQPTTAEQWRVMTLPTTYLFDSKGRPGDCNLGVTRADKLIKQIAQMGAQTERALN